jgi:hypothetical protein
VLAVHQPAVDYFIGVKMTEHCAVTTDNGGVDNVRGIMPFMFKIEIGSAGCNGEMTALRLETLHSRKIALNWRAVLAEKSAVKVCDDQNITEICHFTVPV